MVTHLESDDITILLRLAAANNNSKKLIVFDLDNNLIATGQTFGSDQWLATKISTEPSSPYTALQKHLPLYRAVQNVSRVELVDPRGPAVIASLQQAGHIVVSITSRGYTLCHATGLQLKSVGINFQRGVFADNNSGIKIGAENTRDGDALESQFRYGILFTEGRNKGTCLEELYPFLTREYGINTAELIFIDDRPKHVEDVAQSAAKLGLNATVIRNSKHDPHLEVDPEITALQESKFSIISDAKARNFTANATVMAQPATGDAATHTQDNDFHNPKIHHGRHI